MKAKQIRKLLFFGAIFCFTITQAQTTVSGTVTDATGPMPGINIQVKGTSVGTQTDFDGNYILENIEENATLVFSFIGYSTKEIQINGDTEIDVNMEKDQESLEEVVVIGYGTARRSEITGAVGMVSSEELSEQPSVNPLENLRGKIAGVTVFSNSGVPGGDNKVLIRGQGTINASTEPLYVVDGLQMDNIDYLNPSDIESMEVLKDASSAAIYGARGANGVVLITTQGGLKGGGLAIEFKTNVSAGVMANKRNSLYRPMNSEEFMDVQRIAVENAPYFRDYPEGDEPKLILENDLLFNSQGDPLYNTDWEKEVTRTTFSIDNHLSIRSGNEKSSTGLFINYTDDKGIIKTSSLKRANVKFSYNATLAKWLSMGTDFRLTQVWESVPEVEGSGVTAISRAITEFAPIFPVKWPDGSYSNSTQTGGTSLIQEGAPNPVSVLNEVENLVNRTNSNGSIFADINFTPELTLRTQFGFVNKKFENKYYASKEILNLGYPDGRARIINNSSLYWQNENYLTYEKSLNDSRFTAMLGASWQAYDIYDSNISVYGFNNDFFKYNNVGVAENSNPPQSNYNDWSMNSYFFRGNYSYNDKYTMTVTGRMDGSSRFGSNNKYAFFPSVGVSWNISEENFMSDIKIIDMLRFRASYGVTGNSEMGSYNSLATIYSGTNLIGGELRSTSAFARLANPDLKWERNNQINVGFNLNAFNNIIELEADYYYKLTSDLLLDRPVPSITGFTSIVDNIGEVSNRGLDLMISTRNIETSKFAWTTSFTMNYNKNKVEALGENDEDIFPGPFWVGGSQTILRVGEPVGSFWGYKRLGIWGTDEADEAASEGKLPGMIKRSAEKQIIGVGSPDFRGSFINRFNFGQFDAVIDLQFSQGAEILQQFVTTAEDRQALTNGFKTQLYESWTPENQNTFVPMIRHTVLSGQDLKVDDHWVADGSYIRGNLISLGYTFDNKVIDKLGVNNFRLSFSMENAFVIHSNDFKGYDPESNGQWDDSNFSQNIFFYSYPKARTLIFGLAAKF